METTCVEENCERVAKTRGRCRSHYEKWRKTNRDQITSYGSKWDNPDGSRMTCQKPGCDKPINTQGLCRNHYGNLNYMSTRGLDKNKRYRKLTDYDGNKETLYCTFEGCKNGEFTPGLCAGHYYQGLQGLPLTPLHEKSECRVSNCTGLYSVKLSKSKLCTAHSSLASKYGLTPDELVELFSNPVCGNPGCDEVEGLHIDHDHTCCPMGNSKKCGKCVRGLLCRGCNTSLGYLRDDPNKIRGLMDYLANNRLSA